jgi:hypothetical protein
MRSQMTSNATDTPAPFDTFELRKHPVNAACGAKMM